MRFVAGIAIAAACLAANNVSAGDVPQTETSAPVKLASAELARKNTAKKAPAAAVAAPSQAQPPLPEKQEKVTTTKPDANKVALAVPATPAKAKPAGPSLVARIDLTRQRMHVTAHGKNIASWPISSGRSGYETPPGQFRPKWAVRMHYSRKYNNSPMPYSVFFNGGIATHGTTYTRRLGRPASHGCIRLRTANARTFYKLVRSHGYKRTRIIVTGRAPTKRAVARRSKSRRNSAGVQNANRRNAFTAGRRRYSLGQYERRVKRYYRNRRLVFVGNKLEYR